MLLFVLRFEFRMLNIAVKELIFNRHLCAVFYRQQISFTTDHRSAPEPFACLSVAVARNQHARPKVNQLIRFTPSPLFQRIYREESKIDLLLAIAVGRAKKEAKV